MIRCIPVDGSEPFEVENETACAWNPFGAASIIDPIRLAGKHGPIYAGKLRGVPEKHVRNRAGASTVYAALRPIGEDPYDDYDRETDVRVFVDNGSREWPAVRIESWRERAERLEGELASVNRELRSLRAAAAWDAMDKRRESGHG